MSMWKTIATLFGDLADRPDAADVPYGTGWVDEDDNLSISDGTVWVDVAGGGNPVAVDDDGVEVVADVARLNFGDNLTVTDDGAGEVTIDVDGDGVVCGTDTIPDTETDVDVAHGGGGDVPATVVVTAREVEPLGVIARDGTTFTVARAGSSGDLDFDWMACDFEEPPPPPEEDLLDAVGWASAWWAEGPLFAALGLSDNDRIQTWPDEVGSRDMTQATEASRPRFRASDANFDNRPVVNFGVFADQWWLNGSGSETIVSSPYSFGLVVRINPTGARQHIANMPQGSGFNAGSFWVESNNNYTLFNGSTVGTGVGVGDTDVIVIQWDGSNTIVRVNGTPTSSLSPGTRGARTPAVGQSIANANWWTNGQMAFWGFKSTLMTAQEIEDFEEAAADLYGITLA